MLIPTAPGRHVEFVDGQGAGHVVVLTRLPWLVPVWRARRKLERWRKQGRAFYAPPLTILKAR